MKGSHTESHSWLNKVGDSLEKKRKMKQIFTTVTKQKEQTYIHYIHNYEYDYLHNYESLYYAFSLEKYRSLYVRS